MTTRLRYQPALDGLRAVAILGVMGFHFLTPMVTGGSLGVDVFFVLSGWLITSLLVTEFAAGGRIDYGAFIGRRARRLMPALAVVLIAYAVLSTSPGRWADIAAAALYVTNLRRTFSGATDNMLAHTWSLAIEEQFYLLWPLAIMALMRLGRARAGVLLVCAWVVLTLARWTADFMPGAPSPYYFTPFHATGLLLGSALALRPVKGLNGGVALIGLIGLLIFAHTSENFTFAQYGAEILTAMIIADPPAVLGVAPLRFVGRISYGIYLWHWPLLKILKPHTLVGVVGLFAASILAGWLSNILVERWFLRRAIVTGPGVSAQPA